MSCNESVNVTQDNAGDKMHPLSYLVSTENDDVLYYHEVMKAVDSSLFRDTMVTEFQNFKSEQIFK